MQRPKSADQQRFVGQRVLRFEDPPLLRGQGQFLDDVPVKPGTLHAAILRSPHPHAEIVAIDVAEALKQPGVRAVLTRDEVREWAEPFIVGFANPMDYRGIALDRVRYVGEPVAVVMATDRYKAEDALDFVKVTYRPLPAVVDPLDAARADAPVLHPAAGSNVVSRRRFVHGEPDRAFAEAQRTTEITIRYPRNSITPMEGYIVVAEYKPDEHGYDCLANFQGPFSLHPVMARALKVSGSRFRMRTPPQSGGSFGSKLTLFPYMILICLAARKAGRPVKWVEDRLEHLSSASCAPNRVTRIEAAYQDDGVVTGLRLEHWDDHGAYLRAPMPAPIYRMHGVTTNGYTIRHLEVVNNIIMTNKCPTGAVRGFGGPQLYFAVERTMQRIAVELGLDPLEVIRRNLVPAGAFPYRTIAGALLDSGDYRGLVDKAVAEGGLDALKRRRDQARAEGRLYGIGYAAVVEPSQSNMGYISTLKTGEERRRAGQKDGAVAVVTVNVDPLGAVSVTGDSVPQGQGHQTALAQIVADRLGLRPEDIAVNLEHDTQKDAWSIAAGNYSCRFSPAVASSAHLAATRVRDKLARIASQSLNVPPERIDFKDGQIQQLDNPDNRVSFHRVAGLAHWSPGSLPDGMDPAVREVAPWSAPELTPTSATDEINTSLAYGFGFDFCGIEIDRDTGEVRVDKYVTAHDCGTILNPGLAEGQIRGSFAASFGAALYEEFCYGEDGSFLSGTFAEYLVATAAEQPELQVLHLMETPSPFTRLGAKGIAEGNTYSTPVCIANAVADALGIADVSVPLTPAKVSQWIHGDETPPRRRDGAPQVAAPSARGRELTGEGTTLVAAPPEQVWRMLLEPASLQRILPGCRALASVGDNAYRATIDVGVGPVHGTFEADVQLSQLDPPRALTLSGGLSGPLGASAGEGTIALAPVAEGTRLTYRYRVRVAGKLAAVGGRMLDGAARAVIGQIFRALAAAARGAAPAAVPEAWWRQLLRRLGLLS